MGVSHSMDNAQVERVSNALRSSADAIQGINAKFDEIDKQWERMQDFNERINTKVDGALDSFRRLDEALTGRADLALNAVVTATDGLTQALEQTLHTLERFDINREMDRLPKAMMPLAIPFIILLIELAVANAYLGILLSSLPNIRLKYSNYLLANAGSVLFGLTLSLIWLAMYRAWLSCKSRRLGKAARGPRAPEGEDECEGDGDGEGEGECEDEDEAEGEETEWAAAAEQAPGRDDPAEGLGQPPREPQRPPWAMGIPADLQADWQPLPPAPRPRSAPGARWGEAPDPPAADERGDPRRLQAPRGEDRGPGAAAQLCAGKGRQRGDGAPGANPSRPDEVDFGKPGAAVAPRPHGDAAPVTPAAPAGAGAAVARRAPSEPSETAATAATSAASAASPATPSAPAASASPTMRWAGPFSMKVHWGASPTTRRRRAGSSSREEPDEGDVSL